jgi:phosphate:Na+ symporter
MICYSNLTITIARTVALFLISSLPNLSHAADNTENIAFIPMVVGLLGGLAIFLYGMEKMSNALKRAAGDKMKSLLARFTSNRIAGVMTGTGITAVIQSSSVTTVLLVGFISAGLMSLPQAVGVIMGANIGTTVTAQIVAFKVTKAALAMVAVGFLVQFTAKQDRHRQYGNILFGLGLIFLGMNLMSEAMSPLRAYQPFIDAMAHMDSLPLAILLAAVFTALVQSSSATTGIVIVLAGQGFISLETGIALAMGANLGTCVTALLAAIGKGEEAKQAAAIHIMFNFLGVIIWLPFISLLSYAAIGISPTHDDLSGIERLAAELPRQIANANTLFNVLNTLIMVPFAGFFVSLVRRIIPAHSKSSASSHKPKKTIKPKYLSAELLSTPDMALDNAQLELGRVGRRVCNMLNMLPQIGIQQASTEDKKQTKNKLQQIEKIEDEVDRLHAEILSYLGLLRTEPLSAKQSSRQIKLISMTDQLESVADLVVDSLIPLSYKTLNEDIVVSPTMRETLDTIHDRVNQAMLDCVNAIRRGDDQLAEKVLNAKRELNSLLDVVLAHQAERLMDQDPKRMVVFRYEMEWVESLKRIYNHSKRVAKLQLRKRSMESKKSN